MRDSLGLPDDGLVGVEAEAGKGGEDGMACDGMAARLVDILHADQPDATVRPGIEPTGEGCCEGAEMQRAGGRGREPAAVGGRSGYSRVFSLMLRKAISKPSASKPM